MQPKPVNLDINGSASEITEDIDRLAFWIDTSESSEVKATKRGSNPSYENPAGLCFPVIVIQYRKYLPAG